MQHRNRRLTVVFAGALLTTAGLLAACSTDNGATPLPQAGTDSGRNPSRTDDGADDDDVVEPDAGVTDEIDADCSSAPRLRKNDKGFFCSFFRRDGGTDSGAGPTACGNDETCCNPGANPGGGFPPSFCASTPRTDKGDDNAAAACAAQAEDHGSTWNEDKSSTWECGDSNNCGAGQVCCLYTWKSDNPSDKVNIGKSLDDKIPAACGALQAFKQGGTRCEPTACKPDQVQLCSLTDDNCSGNQKCTPFSALFRDLGTCRQ